LESFHEKIIELRKDFLLHDDTHMMVMLSICTKDMNKYVSMFPDIWFLDCTAGELISLHYLYYGHLSHTMYNFLVKATNFQKKQLFVMAVRTTNESTIPGNLAIIPSEQKLVFHSIYRLAFPYLYSADVCSRNHVVITDEDDAEYRSFESLINTLDIFAKRTVMFCTFHAIWMPLKKDLLPLLDDCPHGKVYGMSR
jgi:hypothetical protein